jgi:restriction system protein
MPIPDFQTAMRPLLEFAKDGAEHSFRDALDALAVVFGVTEEERRMQDWLGKNPSPHGGTD